MNNFEKRGENGKWQELKEKETDEQGIPLLSAFRASSRKRAKETGAGSTTIARAVLVQSINQRMVQGEGQKRWDEVLDISAGVSSSPELDTTARRNIQIADTPLYRILYQSAKQDIRDGIRESENAGMFRSSEVEAKRVFIEMDSCSWKKGVRICR